MARWHVAPSHPNRWGNPRQPSGIMTIPAADRVRRPCAARRAVKSDFAIANVVIYRLEHTLSRPATGPVAPRKVSCGFQPGVTSCRARMPTVATRIGPDLPAVIRQPGLCFCKCPGGWSGSAATLPMPAVSALGRPAEIRRDGRGGEQFSAWPE
jgi:hypothetical protein